MQSFRLEDPFDGLKKHRNGREPVARMLKFCQQSHHHGFHVVLTWLRGTTVEIGDRMAIYAIGEKSPRIDATAFVHPDAVVIGDVRIGAESSVWPRAVLRGDSGAILVGSRTSIQDSVVIHCTSKRDTVIGDGCLIGRGAHLEGCEIKNDCSIGDSSIVLAGAAVGPHASVGTGALVTPGQVVPEGASAIGAPAQITLDAIQPGSLDVAVTLNVDNAGVYSREMRHIDQPLA